MSSDATSVVRPWTGDIHLPKNKNFQSSYILTRLFFIDFKYERDVIFDTAQLIQKNRTSLFSQILNGSIGMTLPCILINYTRIQIVLTDKVPPIV